MCHSGHNIRSFLSSIHLDLVLEDERVVEAIPSIGYIHRGLEKLVEKDFRDYVFISELYGICKLYPRINLLPGVEKIMGVEIPRRAEFLGQYGLNTPGCIVISSGLGVCDSMGYENLFMNCWKVRRRSLMSWNGQQVAG